MKKTTILAIIIFCFSVSSIAQIEMNSYGNVGIGSSPVNGIDLFSAKAKITKLGVNTTPSTTYEFYPAHVLAELRR